MIKYLKYLNIALFCIAVVITVLFFADVVEADVLLFYAYTLVGAAQARPYAGLRRASTLCTFFWRALSCAL